MSDVAQHAAWAVLEIAPTPDPREIKRAYARLAKIHRPEADAAAFQRLRDAYETALELAPQLAATSTDAALVDSADEPSDAAPLPPADAALGKPQSESEPAASAAGDVVSAALDHTAQTVCAWADELNPALDADDLPALQSALARCLGYPLASLAMVRQQFAHAVLNAMMARKETPLSAIDHVSTELGWRDDLTLTREQRTWLQRVAQYRIRLQAEAVARGFAADIAPEAAVAHITSVLSEQQIDGLEDRPWFEMGLMLGLVEPVMAPLPVIDAIAAFFEWQDLAHLRRIEPRLVDFFLQRVQAARFEQNERDYEAGLRAFADDPSPKTADARHARWAARALLRQPHEPGLAFVASLLKPVQQHARAMLEEIETQHPALAAKLDPDARDFWRKPRPQLGDQPLRNLGWLSVPGALCIMYAISQMSGVEDWPGYPLTFWLLVVLGGLLSGVLLTVVLWHLGNDFVPSIARRIQLFLLAWTNRIAPGVFHPRVIDEIAVLLAGSVLPAVYTLSMALGPLNGDLTSNPIPPATLVKDILLLGLPWWLLPFRLASLVRTLWSLRGNAA